MNLKLVSYLLKRDKRKFTWLAEKINMSTQNLYRCIEKNRIEANDLESIATNPDPLDLSQPDRYWALSAEHNDVAIVFNPSPLDSGASSLTGFVSPLQSIIFTLETSDH